MPQKAVNPGKRVQYLKFGNSFTAFIMLHKSLKTHRSVRIVGETVLNRPLLLYAFNPAILYAVKKIK
jgi:hypothetical protein